jgi:sugar lactone lactonase YvrE
VSIVPEPVWRLDALLGEGPVWLPDEQALRFVDIKRGLLHRYDPACDGRDTLEVGGQPSFIVPESGGGLLVGSDSRLFRFDGERLGEPLLAIPQPAHNRTNDATVDHQGRLWFGTMDDAEERPTGAVWCLDRTGLHRAGGEAVVTNGPAVSGDGRFLYHVDSGRRTIWRFVLGPDPVLADGEIFLRLGEEDGYPDGIVVDSEDCLWVALWDGWGVRRYAPDGTLLLHVAFPCARVTKLAFAGPDLRTAYVTTARVGLDATALVQQPLAGSLFAFPAPAKGQALPQVRANTALVCD